MPNKDKLQIGKADYAARKIQLLYLKAIREILSEIKLLKSLEKEIFRIDDYPKLKAKIHKTLKGLTASSVKVIDQATAEQWYAAIDNNQNLSKEFLNRKLLTKAQQTAYLDRNAKALESFQKRKIAGLKLSDKVWKYNNQFKGEIEMGIDVALQKGTSSATLSRKIRGYLQEPDQLFRRVRDKHGSLHLSKMAKKYSAGEGTYRSSYKNAMRLARTEINMAYRTSDFEKYQQLDFVVGFEIKRSRTVFGCDICKDLVGKYPKDFKFVGWHPQCRCYTVPILNSTEDFVEQQKAILNGESYIPAKQQITFPDKFNDWYNKNREKVRTVKKAPYFIRDNQRLILSRTNLDNLMRNAKASAPEVDLLATSIASKFGGYVTPINLKGQGSILRKVSTEYNGQYSQVKDAVRTTMILPDAKISAAIRYMEKLAKFSRIQRQLPSKYQGYSGTITNLKTSKGIFGEIQLNTERMIYAKEKPVDAKRILGTKRWNEIKKSSGLEGGLGHQYYEEYRVLDKGNPVDLKRMKKLEQLSKKYYSNFR